MNKISVAGAGMYVVLITLALNLAGIEPEPGSVEALVNATAALTGFVLWLIGQLRRSDLKAGLIRKI